MTWDNKTCDDCTAPTEGGPALWDEIWMAIAGPAIDPELYVSEAFL
jgi:hypothetical protein